MAAVLQDHVFLPSAGPPTQIDRPVSIRGPPSRPSLGPRFLDLTVSDAFPPQAVPAPFAFPRMATPSSLPSPGLTLSLESLSSELLALVFQQVRGTHPFFLEN